MEARADISYLAELILGIKDAKDLIRPANHAYGGFRQRRKGGAH